MDISRNSKKETEGNSSEAQRNRLLAYLKLHGSITTIQARHEPDIVAPAPRVHDLRHRFGFDIETTMISAANPGGGQHRIARYALHADG